ncbi:MAG: CBS domain-containing protein [Candidatus Micrarchaeia archaeon]
MTLDSLDDISRNIRHMRTSLGLSQKALARLVGASQSEIARLEKDPHGLNPSYDMVFRVVDALNEYAARGGESLMARKVQDVMHKRIVFLKPGDTVEKAIKIIRENDFSQIPVIRNGISIGTVYQKDILRALKGKRISLEMRIDEVMSGPLPQVDKDTPIGKLNSILESWEAVLIADKSKIVGIVTIFDIFGLLQSTEQTRKL